MKNEFQVVIPLNGRERPLCVGTHRGCRRWLYSNVDYLNHIHYSVKAGDAYIVRHMIINQKTLCV